MSLHSHKFDGADGKVTWGRLDVHTTVTVGEYTVIEESSDDVGYVGAGSEVGSFCRIAASARIGERVIVDHYVLVGERTEIGDDTRLLYRVSVYNDVRIGRRSIVSGDVPNGVLIGNDVIYMGEIAHSHRNADIPWDNYQEPSPIINDCSVVGVRALLIGPVCVGPRSYVGAGEVVRHDIPPETVFMRGHLTPLGRWKGLISLPAPRGGAR